uniref:R13L1/DRL21-like LRR repeat region domain-containing protein n=1 Tax=Ananas comosus var. bracteatus TaxID=296719 RepID=A0A6V7QW98_ANACO
MNLRILSVPSIQSLPRIGKLTSLQALIWFSIEDKAGHRITELGKMTGLRELMITNLEKVKSAEEAAGANLSKKEQLSLLSLRWGTAPRDDESDEQLLDHLRPHSNLKHLEIHGYNGRRSLHWMRNEYTPRLAHIRISVKQLGPEFYGAHGVSSAFPSLGTLQLNRMTGLENWDGGVEDDQWFPCLNKLGVARCPRLSALPPIPICLRELELNFLEITTLPKVWVPNQTSRHHISSPPSSLSSVVIVECSKLKSLSQGLFGHPERLLCLENLSIQNCAELFPGGLDASLRHLLHGLASLSSLKLSHCTNLTSFPSGDVLRTLRTLSSLSLQKCHELVSLDGLQFLPSLKTLEIKECRKLIPEAEAEVEASSPMLVEVPSLALDRLDVDDPSMLLVVPLRSLTSTRSVHIRGCSHISAVTESWLSQNRASLQSLVLDGGVSLQSLPDTLQSLSLLRYLALQNAGQLQSLPLLPRSLKTLNISGCCPELAENCKTEMLLKPPNKIHFPLQQSFNSRNSVVTDDVVHWVHKTLCESQRSRKLLCVSPPCSLSLCLSLVGIGCCLDMVGVALTVAGWFVSSIIGKLIDGALAYVKDHKQWRSAMAAELKRLEMARPQIEGLVDAAENGGLSVPSPLSSDGCGSSKTPWRMPTTYSTKCSPNHRTRIRHIPLQVARSAVL